MFDMSQRLLFCLLLELLLFSSCKLQDNVYSIRLNWIPSCSFVGEILGVQDFQEQNDVKLVVNRGGLGLDPIKLVQSGEDDFGVCGADLVLAANDKGADFVIVGVVNNFSPGVFLSKAEKNINSINDLFNKRIGELPGGNMQYLYEVFLKTVGLERNKNFQPVPIPYELKNFIIQDECDVRPVFIHDEPSELDLNGIQYNIIEPKDLGISFKGIVYFCRRSLINENPELVQKFINTMIDGWDAAIKDPNRAIEALKKYDPTINEEKELNGLIKGMTYFMGYEGKLLYSDTDSWSVMIDNMKDIGVIKNDIDVTKIINMSFVENYYMKATYE